MGTTSAAAQPGQVGRCTGSVFSASPKCTPAATAAPPTVCAPALTPPRRSQTGSPKQPHKNSNNEKTYSKKGTIGSYSECDSAKSSPPGHATRVRRPLRHTTRARRPPDNHLSDI